MCKQIFPNAFTHDKHIFGPGGEGHMRLNIGCPRSVLDKALNALKKAVDKK